MSRSTLSEPLRRAVRQNARTLQLLGVDFVPMRASPAESPAAAAELEPKPALFSPAPEAGTIEVRPPRPASAAAPAPSSPAAAAGKLAPQHAAELLEELRQRYEREAPHSRFVTDHHSIVFGEGDPCARLMFIGEAPGAEEDRTGRPFVGRAGQLLDKMINAMGLAREQVYIANVLKTRPPNNATPTSDECAACAPFLYEQIMIIRPEVIVTLGLPASRTLLNSMESMGALRGRWWTFRPPAPLLAAAPGGQGLGTGWTVPIMPTYHPAFLLRSYTTENRQKVWADLRLAMERLGLATASTGLTANSPGEEG
ncbi:MAG: uracil-DNA glycosylase [Phycisphaeraceae bacterium]|nr:uracil-DNA glycosylase [Phycisphaeraceae bacterium]